jgi:lipopolysaccharide biosynthesis glycosyltransferase
MQYKNNIPVVLIADEFYAPYLSVTMQSVMENANQQNKYKFYILFADISLDTQNILKNQVRKYPNFLLEFKDISKLIRDYTFSIEMWSREVFFKLIIPYIFMEYEYIIYLDSDVICRIDIAELIDFGIAPSPPEDGIVMFAVPEIIQISWYYFLKNNNEKPSKKINMSRFGTSAEISNPENYFCTGILLFKPKEFIAIMDMKDLLSFACSRLFKCVDQDILNIVCDGKTKLFPISYGYEVHNHWMEEDFVPDKYVKDLQLAKENPKIIHFLCKPWTRFFHVEYFYEWWKYATRTPFSDIITQRMNEKKLIGFDTWQGLC